MTQMLHLAGPADLDRIEGMMALCHAETGTESDASARRAALAPLLDGSPHGAVWLVGPRMASVGYLAIGFGWSLEAGGLAGTVEDFWIREKVRGRGMGSEALSAAMSALRDAGLCALHLRLPDERPGERTARRLGFRRRGERLMTWAPGAPILAK